MRFDGHGLRRLTAILGAFVLTGCYTYVPVERPRPGTPVRLLVPVRSSIGSSRTASEMVPFEGTLVALTDTLLLEVRSRQAIGAHGEMLLLDTIRVNGSEYRNLEERVLSRSRTVILSAALVAGGVLAALAIDGLAGSEGDEKPGDTTNPQGQSLPPSGWDVLGIRIALPWPPG